MTPDPPRVGDEIAVTVLGRTSRFRVVDVVDGEPVVRKVEGDHDTGDVGWNDERPRTQPEG